MLGIPRERQRIWRDSEDAYRLFFVNSAAGQYVGYRTRSAAHAAGTTTLAYEPYVRADMLHGRAHDVVPDGDSFIIEDEPLHPSQRASIFAHIAGDPGAIIEYTAASNQLGPTQEVVVPLSAWDPTPARCGELDAGEQVYRDYTTRYLANRDLTGQTVFDPACSTGAFLASIKHAHPNALTVGQDLHPAMVEVAKTRGLDRVTCQDAAVPMVPASSVDVLVVRFLLVGIVTRQSAAEHYRRLLATVRPGGCAIIIGYTPIVVPASALVLPGWSLRQAIGHDRRAGIFQYYVVQRNRDA